MTDAVAQLDDPAHISTFLAMIGASRIDTPLTSKPAVQPEFASIVNQEVEKENVPSSTFTVSSPERGIGAPPPTPSGGAVAADPFLAKLAPVEEDDNVSHVFTQLASKSNLGLHHSRYAPNGLHQSKYAPNDLHHSKYAPNDLHRSKYAPNSVESFSQKTPITPQRSYDRPKVSFSNKFALLAQEADPENCSGSSSKVARIPRMWEDRVVSDFRKSHIDDVAPEVTPRIKQEDPEVGVEQSTAADSATSSNSSPPIPFPEFEHIEDAAKTSDGENPTVDVKTSQDTEGSPAKHTRNVNIADKRASFTLPSRTTDSTAEEDVACTKTAIAALQRATAHKLGKEAGSPKVPNIIVTDTAAEDEDRENSTHFSNWGSPAKRDKPKSGVRKIVLSGLPLTADLTLVQSLISGGTIDKFVLGPSKTTAFVTFTTAEACEKFYAKYPNGIIFKHRGRSCNAFVEKGGEVDVISGMLQGWLECGASRCVRATGADEEWGVRALQKLAEGKERKVENIIDTYRNGIRTIVFRFSSIADAVVFKGVLIRHDEWEGCNIQFMDDPCEKATGVHLE